jgi:hypothetical protein
MELVRQAESKTLARKTCASMLPQSFDDTLAAALPGAGVFRKPIGIKLLHYADCNINVSSPSGTRTLDQDFVKQSLSGDNLACFAAQTDWATF